MLSAVVDNVPLVAGAMGMYPIEDAASIAAMTDPAAIEYASNFVQDGLFWEFLAYCAGTGGSILIIGSAAGVAAMGMEKIDFIWYMKRISLLALAGICGRCWCILPSVSDPTPLIRPGRAVNKRIKSLITGYTTSEYIPLFLIYLTQNYYT